MVNQDDLAPQVKSNSDLALSSQTVFCLYSAFQSGWALYVSIRCRWGELTHTMGIAANSWHSVIPVQ